MWHGRPFAACGRRPGSPVKNEILDLSRRLLPPTVLPPFNGGTKSIGGTNSSGGIQTTLGDSNGGTQSKVGFQQPPKPRHGTGVFAGFKLYLFVTGLRKHGWHLARCVGSAGISSSFSGSSGEGLRDGGTFFATTRKPARILGRSARPADEVLRRRFPSRQRR